MARCARTGSALKRWQSAPAKLTGCGRAALTPCIPLVFWLVFNGPRGRCVVLQPASSLIHARLAAGMNNIEPGDFVEGPPARAQILAQGPQGPGRKMFVAKSVAEAARSAFTLITGAPALLRLEAERLRRRSVSPPNPASPHPPRCEAGFSLQCLRPSHMRRHCFLASITDFYTWLVRRNALQGSELTANATLFLPSEGWEGTPPR
jgi:hypothetical protein